MGINCRKRQYLKKIDFSSSPPPQNTKARFNRAFVLLEGNGKQGGGLKGGSQPCWVYVLKLLIAGQIGHNILRCLACPAAQQHQASYTCSQA